MRNGGLREHRPTVSSECSGCQGTRSNRSHCDQLFGVNGALPRTPGFSAGMARIKVTAGDWQESRWELRSVLRPDRPAEPWDVRSTSHNINEERAARLEANAAGSRCPPTSLRRFGESIPGWLRPRRASVRFTSLMQNAIDAASSHHSLIVLQICGMTVVRIFSATQIDVSKSGSSILSSHSSTADACSVRMQMACMIRF